MSKCIKCIKDKVTGECYDIKDETARIQCEELHRDKAEKTELELVNEVLEELGSTKADKSTLDSVNRTIEDIIITSNIKTITPNAEGNYSINVWEVDKGIYYLPPNTNMYFMSNSSIEHVNLVDSCYLFRADDSYFTMQKTVLYVGIISTATNSYKNILNLIQTYANATISGLFTFNTTPKLNSSITKEEHIVNKEYVDNAITESEEETKTYVNTAITEIEEEAKIYLDNYINQKNFANKTYVQNSLPAHKYIHYIDMNTYIGETNYRVWFSFISNSSAPLNTISELITYLKANYDYISATGYINLGAINSIYPVYSVKGTTNVNMIFHTGYLQDGQVITGDMRAQFNGTETITDKVVQIV